MPEITPEQMLTRNEVANMIGVTSKTLCEWEREGRGPAVVRLSPKIARYPTDAIAKFLAKATAGGAR